MMHPTWNLSCPNWAEKLENGETPIPELPLFKRDAEAAVAYFDKLCVPDAPGQPPMSKAAGEWFRDVVRAAFGSVEPETQHRFIDEIFLLVPKKNAKSTYTAALGLVALLMNDTPNVEGVIVGSSIEVANTCFKQAAGMIEADDYLSKRFHIDYHQRIITDLDADPVTGRPKKAQLKIKSFNPKVATGVIPAFAIIDELHVMGEAKDADRVLGQITGGGVTAQTTFVVYLTTQSEREPAGVFKEKLQYARSVRDGTAEGVIKLLPVIYEFPEAVQTDETKPWLDPKKWSQVLPNLNRSVFIEKLIPKFDEARQKDKAELARWASQHLNVEIGLALHSERWIGADYWTSCVDSSLVDREELYRRSEVIVAGFDGGGLDDLAGISLVGRCRETRNWLGWFRAWAHPIVFERQPEIETRLRDFAADGDLILVEEGDPLQIFREVTAIMVEVQDLGLFPKSGAIGLDSQAVADLVDMLELAGFTIGGGFQVEAVPQGWKLSSAIWGWELKLSMRTYRHAGRPLMNWVLGNAKAQMTGKNIYISKSVAGKAKIDPLTAGFNSYQLMARNPEPSGRGIQDYFSALQLEGSAA